MSLTEKNVFTINSKLNKKNRIDLDIKNSNVRKEKRDVKLNNTYIIWRILNILVLIVAFLVNVLVPKHQVVNDNPYKVFLLLLIACFAAMNIATVFNDKIKKIVNEKAQFYFGIGLTIILWDLVTEKFALLPLPFFPSLAQILQVMVEDYNTLIISTGHSIRLLVIGFIIGTVLGVVIGVLIGWYKKWHYWIFPIVKVIGVVPATAWIPIIMFIFPSSFYAQISLIVICVTFPVSFMTCSGIQNLPKSYFEAAKTLGAKEGYLIFNVAIPGAMPSIFTGIYTATGISFATLVVSEMIGAKAGLGWYINWAKGWSDYAKVYASIIIMAIVFSLVMAVIFRIRDRVLIWQRGLLK